jgi:hypothetical protein
MTTLFETPMQSERDLRSAHKERKRSKDSTAKWTFGARPSGGCHLNLTTYETEGGSEAQRSKMRPMGKYSDDCGASRFGKQHNMVKMTRANYNLPPGRVKSRMDAAEEVLSYSELPSPGLSTSQQMMSFSDHILYSFDQSDTPGKPVSLEVFVKQPTGRDTERLVEKEYEILDENGEPLKGRKARNILRKSGSDLAKDEPVVDEDFELV